MMYQRLEIGVGASAGLRSARNFSLDCFTGSRRYQHHIAPPVAHRRKIQDNCYNDRDL